MFLKNVRYEKISFEVYNIFVKCKIDFYPLNLEYLLKKLNCNGFKIELDSYKNFSEITKYSIKYLKTDFFKSEDGATVYISEADLYIIFINYNNFTKFRINWTIAHEIAHIILGHYKYVTPILLNRRGIPETYYEILEREADWFTKLLLCHPLVLSSCGFNSIIKIQKVCNISKSAAENRLKEINKPFTFNPYNKWDRKIVNLFESFIFKRRCKKCNRVFIKRNSVFCPSCKSKYLIWDDCELFGNTEIDKHGKALVCPRCDNEENSQGSYCKICGAYLINKCESETVVDELNYGHKESCGNILNEKDRFCCLCGNMSYFNKNNLLPPWN